jgi:hypothetical protein
MCPGQKLAIIKVKIAVISIVKNYRLTTCKNTEVNNVVNEQCEYISYIKRLKIISSSVF